VLIVSGMYLHPDTLVLLRRAGRRVGVLLTESPYDLEPELRFAALADVVWTNERTCVEGFRRVCPHAFYLPCAFNATRHAPGAPAAGTPRHDVVFVGTAFQERIELLRTIDWRGIDLGLYGNWQSLGSRSPLRQYVRAGTVTNDQALELYRAAKIGLNLHRLSKGWGRKAPRIAGAESLNPRAYELAAAGCFTVSDFRPELVERFGDLVPTFRDPAEAGALIRAWLADDEGRERLRLQLPAAVTGHDWHARAGQLLADLASVETSGAPAVAVA
jgi:spore maturation protein CgeB